MSLQHFVPDWEGSFSPGMVHAIKILNIGTDRSGQTVQTQIRLLLKEQSDQGEHCLPFNLHLLDALLN